jgi:hypothetical protein
MKPSVSYCHRTLSESKKTAHRASMRDLNKHPVYRVGITRRKSTGLTPFAAPMSRHDDPRPGRPPAVSRARRPGSSGRDRACQGRANPWASLAIPQRTRDRDRGARGCGPRATERRSTPPSARLPAQLEQLAAARPEHELGRHLVAAVAPSFCRLPGSSRHDPAGSGGSGPRVASRQIFL